MGITVNCNEELCPVLRPTPDLKPNTTPAPETTAAPKAGVSLKEYQKQLDIFKKSIDVQSHDMVKLKALLDKVQGDLSEEKTEREKSDQTEKESRRQSDAQIQGALSKEKTIREQSDKTIEGRVHTLETTVVRICSQDSDCAEPMPFCLNGLCSITECTENSHCQGDKPACDTVTGRCYNWHQNTLCRGDYNSTYDTLEEATTACQGSCGCIADYFCAGASYVIKVGTSTITSTSGTCSWVKN